MPRVPGVPTLDPVNQPSMSPSEAGRAGDAIAQAGASANDAAYTGLQLEYRIREAQKSVDQLTAQNDYAAADAKYQEALAKTTNSHDVGDVTTQAKDSLNQIAKRWAKSPASVEIQQYGDSLIPKMDHLGVVRTVDLQTKEGQVQSEIQLQTLLPQLVTAQRNGDKAQVDYINGYISHMYDDLTKNGLMSDAEKEVALNKVQIQFRTQLNDAAISSASPQERQQAIAQLTKGGDGPLNLTGLAAGDIAALRTQAEATDERLTNLAEARNLNGALNMTQAAFAAPEYKNNYEARINSLQDGDWLTKHGIVDASGQPDRVMAEKLIAETTRQRAEWEKEQQDRDTKAAEKLSPLIDENRMSFAQLNTVLNETEDLSPKVGAQMVRQWRENTNENIRLANESYEVAQRAKAQQSQDVAGEFYLQIARGAVPSELDVMTTPGMTKTDKAAVVADIARAKKEPDFLQGLTIIGNAYPTTKKMSAGEKSMQGEYFAKTRAAYINEINAHPDEDKSQIAAKLVMPGLVRNAIVNSVTGIFPAKPSLWQRMLDSAHSEVDAIEGPRATPSPKSAPTSGPAVGTIQHGTDGDYKFKGGDQYDKANWEKVAK